MLKEAQFDSLRNQFNLSTQELKALFWWVQGEPVKCIDNKIGTKDGVAKIYIAKAQKKTGVYSKFRLLELILGTFGNYVAPDFL